MIFRRRYHLRGKETKRFLLENAKKLNLDITEFLKARFEVVDLISKNKIFLMKDKAVFLKIKGETFPTLMNDVVLNTLPTITVDVGAVPHICNGADVMAPGVIRVEGEFKAGDIAVVLEERFSKRIAICKTLYNASKISEKKYGKVAKNVHYVNDSFWKAFKQIV